LNQIPKFIFLKNSQILAGLILISFVFNQKIVSNGLKLLDLNSNLLNQNSKSIFFTAQELSAQNSTSSPPSSLSLHTVPAQLYSAFGPIAGPVEARQPSSS
jgi:hypothetical protein